MSVRLKRTVQGRVGKPAQTKPGRLPPNMLREIFKVADKHTQSKMRVLNKSTLANKNMPARSYLRGTGKHQRLFKHLYDNLMHVTSKWVVANGAHPSEYSSLGIKRNRYLPRTAATVLRCFIKGYKKMKPITEHAVVNVTNFAKQAKCDAEVYPGGSGYQQNNWTRNGVFQALKAALSPRMTLEDMMDAVLVHFNQVYMQSKRAMNAAAPQQAHLAGRGVQEPVPGQQPTMHWLRQELKRQRKLTSEKVGREYSLVPTYRRNLRVQRRALRRGNMV